MSSDSDSKKGTPGESQCQAETKNVPSAKTKRGPKRVSAQGAPNSGSRHTKKEKTPWLIERANNSEDEGIEEGIDWDDLEEEVDHYKNSDWFPHRWRLLPYKAGPSAPPMACPVIDPRKRLQEKIKYLKEQVRLETEHQELIEQLEKIKIGKIKNEAKAQVTQNVTPPHRGAVLRQPPQLNTLLDLEDPSAYPVTETTDQQGKAWRHHAGFNFKIIKELKTAVAQYGATAPYTTAILESVAENWLTPGDWQTLARATLSGGDYLLWKSEFYECCKETARHNAQANNNWNFDMLAGEGNYATSDAQLQYDAGLYAQIQTVGTKAWRKLPTKGDVSASLTSIKQGPDEHFSEFVHRLITAAGRIFGNADAGTDFVKQLAFENANAACQAAIRP
uniref:Retroviral nucleocapsid Gag protein p24 C-terminal domain-containing protein n=1 Tax=Callithrix jacchus TaxID=9483 RepID=A0A5F4W7C0_CALJA